MSEDLNANAFSTIRWHVMNEWGKPEAKEAILDICQERLGYAPAGGASSPVIAGGGQSPAAPAFGPVRIAIVVGHNSRAPGAESADVIGQSEFDFNNRVADEMVRLCPPELTISKFNRLAAGSYGAEIDAVYAKVNAWKADGSIELHFNSAGPTATGTETFTGLGVESRNMGLMVHRAMLAALKLRDRGCRNLNPDDRGYRSIIAGKAPAILVEPFFGSNRDDCVAVAKLGHTGMAKMYLSGLVEYAKSKRK